MYSILLRWFHEECRRFALQSAGDCSASAREPGRWRNRRCTAILFFKPTDSNPFQFSFFFFSRRKKGQWAYLHDEPELIFLPLCSMLFEVETVKCRNVGMEAQVSQYHKFFLNFFDIIRNLLHHLDGHRLTWPHDGNQVRAYFLKKVKNERDRMI